MRHSRLLGRLAVGSWLASAVVLAFGLGATLGCSEPRSASPPTALRHEVLPRVFRSALDGRSRVLVAEVAPQLWAAWEVDRVSLFKVWRDGVFDARDGAARGPDLRSRGNAWLVNRYPEPWRVRLGGRDLRPHVRYLGHVLDDERPTLRYELVADDVGPIRIDETPRRVTGPSGAVGFERRFMTRGVPAGATVLLDVALGPLDPHVDVETDGDFRPRRTFGDAQAAGRLALRGNAETRLVLRLRGEPGLLPMTSTADERSRGQLLVEQNDCLACHALERGTVGPPFRSLAARYGPDDAEALAHKLVEGGSGVWGDDAMSAHPVLPAADARAMVEWILSLESTGPPAAPAPPARGPASRWHDALARCVRFLRGLWPGAVEPAAGRADRLVLETVHPSFDLETIPTPGFRPHVGGLAFLSDGRLVVASSDAIGGVYLIEGLLTSPPTPRVKRIAAGLDAPVGLEVVDDEIFVLQKPELTQLVDRDGDGVVDEYRTVCQDWPLTTGFDAPAAGAADRDGAVYAAPGGLAYRDGSFYAALGAPGGPADASAPGRGRLARIERADDARCLVARGPRLPGGVGSGPLDRLYVTEGAGSSLPASRLLALSPGVEGAPVLAAITPAVWLRDPEAEGAPGQLASLDVGPYGDQLVVADAAYGGLERASLELVGGTLQGAVFPFSRGFEAGVRRLVWGPDGRLYLGGLGDPGGVGGTAGADEEGFSLQRLAWNGRSTFEMRAVRLRPEGFEIELTEPAAPGSGGQPEDYALAQWRPPRDDPSGGSGPEVEALPVRSLAWSDDRRRVRLVVPGLRAERVVHLRLAKSRFTSDGGRPLWSAEAWYTVHALADAAPAER